jgi:hypothetical protein
MSEEERPKRASIIVDPVGAQAAPPAPAAPVNTTVATAYALVRTEEERLAELDARLEELRKAVGLDADGTEEADSNLDAARADLAASTKEHDAIMHKIDRLRAEAERVSARELSVHLNEQAAQCRKSFATELRNTSEALYRARPSPAAHGHMPRSSLLTFGNEGVGMGPDGVGQEGVGGRVGDKEQWFGTQSGASSIGGEQTFSRTASPRVALSSRRSLRTSTPAARSVATPAASSRHSPPLSSLGMGVGGSLGGCSSSVSMGSALISSTDGLPPSLARPLTFASLAGADAGSSVGIGGKTSPRSMMRPYTQGGGSALFSGGSPCSSPRSSPRSPGRSPGRSPRLAPLSSLPSSPLASASLTQSLSLRPDTASPLVLLGIGGGAGGALTLDKFAAAQAAYEQQKASMAVPRRSQLSRVPKPSLLRRSPAIAATPGVPFSWYSGGANPDLEGLFMRSERLDAPMDASAYEAPPARHRSPPRPSSRSPFKGSRVRLVSRREPPAANAPVGI